ncbi:MAG: polyprenyl synthetase family protein [Oscillospiraceae bacterium]|jgi:geranylgeranyl diphosphate synthase type II|nr:polyprenyl synthetase family protein [Oscillospiraceae bacterium]
MKERLSHWAADIERELEGFCVPESPAHERFAEMLRYGLLGGGKRLRGGLLLAASEAMGGNYEEALRFAAALECIHAFSLVHDDLPAMDDSDTRRGKPSHHKVYGEGMAVLSGDAMLAIAAERMLAITANAGLNTGLNGEDAGEALRGMKRRADAALTIMRSAGMRGIAAGQFMDLEGTGAPQWQDGGFDARAALLTDIDQRTTAEMFRAAVEAGFILAGASDEETKAAVSFGLKMGMVFQIRDDVQDVGADDGLITWPAVYGIEESRRRADELEREALKGIEPLGARCSLLKEFAELMRGFA